MGPRLHLKYKGIAPKTSRVYRKEVDRFFQYLSAESIVLPSCLTDLDAILAEYVNVMYQNGDSLTQAGWLLSGLRRFLPEVRFRIPTAQQYYQNWVRDHVPFRAVPLPWLVVKALSAAAYQSGHKDLAVLLLLAFCFFLRSVEFITLRRDQIVLDLQTGQVILTLERTKTSKQFQQSLVLRHRKLTNLLAKALTGLPSSGPIWPYSAAQFRSCFTALLDHFALVPYNFSLYSIRRGGATHSYVQSRDLNSVAIQGRWRDLKTARIYLDDARATLVKLSFAPPISHHLTATAAFWHFFR